LNNNTQLNANTSPMIPSHSVTNLSKECNLSEEDNSVTVPRYIEHIIVDVIPPAPVTIVSSRYRQSYHLHRYISSRLIDFEMIE